MDPVMDEQGFTEMVSIHTGVLRSLIRRSVPTLQDAEDVMQETLVKAWLHMDGLKDPMNFKPWILRIARNACKDFYRKRTGTHRSTVHMDQFPADRNGLKGGMDAADDLDTALTYLPHGERELVEEYYFMGYTVRELASQSGKPEGTIKRHLHEARKHLKDIIREGGK